MRMQLCSPLHYAATFVTQIVKTNGRTRTQPADSSCAPRMDAQVQSVRPVIGSKGSFVRASLNRCAKLKKDFDLTTRSDCRFKHGGHRMKSNRGFSLLELLIVVAIILIIATIAIPSLLRSRQAAQESSAVAQLRTINTAQVTYLSSY